MQKQQNHVSKTRVRPVGEDEAPQIVAIINAAAEAYRGQIPDDCWHEPYMRAEELQDELAAGVSFHGIDVASELAAVMGVQRVPNVHLIRHAYVRPDLQGAGLGGQLLEHICNRIEGQVLVGTWRAASWAIAFYERHGFVLLPQEKFPTVLRTYWNISERQVETSVVLERTAVAEHR